MVYCLVFPFWDIPFSEGLNMLDLILSAHLILGNATYSLDPYFFSSSYNGGYCRLCSENDSTEAYSRLASKIGNFSMLKGKVSLTQVCYNHFFTDVFWVFPGYSFGSSAYEYLVPYIDGRYLISTAGPSEDSQWDYLGDCLPSLPDSQFITFRYCPSENPDCSNQTPIYFYSKSATQDYRSSRVHSIFAADSKGFYRTEVYMADSSGSVPVPVPKPRTPQDKNAFDCVKSKFMTKFPFDFFEMPNATTPGCITTNYLGHENKLCNEVWGIFDVLRIGSAIAFAIAFYLYL